MTKVELLIEEIEALQPYLDEEVGESGEEVLERMRKLQSYLSRTGAIWVEAKVLLRAKRSTEIANTILDVARENFLSKALQNALLESVCLKEEELVDKAERANRTCFHQLDSLRSILSYEKTDLQLNKTGY